MRAFAERLAQPVLRATYSARARAAADDIERLAKQNPFLALIAPRGTDVVAWSARAHCLSPRHEGPLVVIDVASASDDLRNALGEEDSSLLRLADGGTLVVIGLSLLPLAVHEKFAIALSRRSGHVPHSSILPPGVVLISPLPLPELVERGLMSSNLARWFGEAEVELPPLVQRAEDFRAIALDLLAKKSSELGRPAAGIEPSALRLLLEHSWPENELELALVLARALAVAEGPAITASDLERTGFVAVEPANESDDPRPVSRRRASFRPR
jgi:DNA-binding NtrC family response regulator